MSENLFQLPLFHFLHTTLLQTIHTRGKGKKKYSWETEKLQSVERSALQNKVSSHAACGGTSAHIFEPEKAEDQYN